jgi:hypothetical protein
MELGSDTFDQRNPNMVSHRVLPISLEMSEDFDLKNGRDHLWSLQFQKLLIGNAQTTSRKNED